MKKVIIGLTGEMGSGKDTFCNYVKENYKNVFVLRFSEVLTDVLKIFFDEIKREDQSWLGSSLKDRFGSDILVRALIKKANSIKEGIVILNGVRSKGEEKIIRENGGRIIYVTADPKLRWERVCIRKEKADDDISYEKFLEMHKLSTEVPVPKIGKEADFKLQNNGSKAEFYKEIKKTIDLLQ